jgi:hypothetical protein
MTDKVTLFSIYDLVGIGDAPCNQRILPFEIIPGFTVEDVKPMFSADTFTWVQSELGKRDLKELQSVEYAIVHRYTTEEVGHGNADDQKSEQAIKNLVACLRLIRPTRQTTSLMRGELGKDGKINIQHFEHPKTLLDVPELQKLFHIRVTDLALLKDVAPHFMTAMRLEAWKFRMAVQFHEAGHFQDWFWKSRYTLWCSALESIFTSQTPEHRGSLVARERIKWFLGENRCIYDPGDIPDYIDPKPNVTIGTVVEDLYTIRNFIAHGDRIPDEFFQRKLRRGLAGELSVVEVMIEALSFITRKSLLRILRENLLQHFMDAAASDAYFGAAGLTNMAIRQSRKKP